MKKNLKLLVAVILLSFISCSKDEIDQNNELHGVWERSDFSDNSGYKLVFGSDNSGLKIYIAVNEFGEATSSASSFNWKVIDNKVTVSENDISQDIFVINSEGQLLLSTLEDLHFKKVSDNYLEYY